MENESFTSGDKLFSHREMQFLFQCTRLVFDGNENHICIVIFAFLGFPETAGIHVG